MHPNTQIIMGPPGTGKTTKLLTIVEDLLAREICRPDEICFISFTRKAANEARVRAMERFKLDEDQLPWFRTLHSLAFKQLGVNRAQVMGVRDYLALAQMLGLHITLKQVNEDGTFVGSTRGDRLFFTEMMARARDIPLFDHWSNYPDEDLSWHELDRLAKTLLEYKQVQGKIDFIDMIHNFNDSPKDFAPPTTVLIVDEAQDLTKIQWDMVQALIECNDRTYIAGDDDQAIFRWAGADVDRFIDFPGTREVLPQSYRVPIKVQELANDVISRVDKRIPKSWKSRAEMGHVEFITDLDQVDLSKGTWLLLARNAFLLQQYVDHCIRAGYVFDSAVGSPVKSSEFEAICLWEDLRKGKAVPVAGIQKIYDQLTIRKGIAYGSKAKLDRVDERASLTMPELVKDYGLLVSDIWHQSLDKLPQVSVEYFISCLRKGEKLLRVPRIKISTIHGVKGGEADNVLILTDMAMRTYSEFQTNPDDEHRVWYVALTRARQNLYIMQPRTNLFYEI